jgi:hypothetical protein
VGLNSESKRKQKAFDYPYFHVGNCAFGMLQILNLCGQI